MIIRRNEQQGPVQSAAYRSETANESIPKTGATTDGTEADVRVPAREPAASALENLRRRAGRLQNLLNGVADGAQREALIVEAAHLLLRSAVSFASRFLEEAYADRRSS